MTEPLAPRPEPAAIAEADQCSLCGTCQSVCPLLRVSAREELGPRAKQSLARSIMAGRLAAPPAAALAALCYACGRCRDACPRRISAARTVQALRASHPGFRQWLWKTWLKAHRTLWPALAWSGGLDLLPENFRAFKRPAADSAWLRPLPPAPQRAAHSGTFTIFPGCLAARVRKDWSAKAKALLAITGRQVLDAPDFACCGFSLAQAGLTVEADKARRKNLRLWRKLGRPNLVVFCASCRQGLLETAQDRQSDFMPGEAEEFKNSIIPLAALLDELEFDLLPGAPARAHYHRPCHGRAGDFEVRLLRRVLGAKLGRLTEKECCGLGGILQLSAPELAALGAAECLETLDPGADDQILTGCSGCLIQLKSRAGQLSVGHWLDILRI